MPEGQERQLELEHTSQLSNPKRSLQFWPE
jgi:hypothetical protein